MTVDELIQAYGLKSHPEGGYFKETYRAQGRIPATALPKDFNGDRNYATAVFFLLPEGERSHMHRIRADELWHFYLGGALTLVQISPSGQIEKIVMGTEIKKGQKVQHVVPAGYWFGPLLTPAVPIRLSVARSLLVLIFQISRWETGPTC